MKLFITTIFVAASLCSIDCAQLNNNYLPPVGASQAGGTGLQAPKVQGNNALGGISPSFPGANPPSQPQRPSQPPSSPGRPVQPQPNSASGPIIEIISYENVNNGDGSFKWSYESANGIRAEETGDVKNKGSENAIQTVQGSYSYTSPEGQLIQITYTADDNGFQATGDALPTPVPLPEENLRAIAEHEAALATAVPDTGSPQNPQSGPSSQPRPPSSQPRPPISQPGSPSRPSNQPAPPASTGFSNQPRPGSGSGNYSPQSGYKY